jgi:diguanylate cyclase (GGDEF)-like protein/PAS domain S-box-containing protein
MMTTLLDRAAATIATPADALAAPAEEEIRRLRAALAAFPDPLFFVDHHRLVLIDANAAACLHLGYTADELKGLSLTALRPLASPDELADELTAAASTTRQSRSPDVLLRDKSGRELLAQWRVRPTGDAPDAPIVVVARLATALDPLTQLPDRRLLRARLVHALRRARDDDQWGFALMFVDLDGFKRVNDTLGHRMGDRLLVQVAQRLKAGLRPTDWLARWGGDEFAVVLDGVHRPAAAHKIARRVRAELCRPLTIGGRRLRISASIGIAINRSGTLSPQKMLDRADRAMYEAKARGGATAVVWNRRRPS